jgi:hypothetical protein
MVAVENPNRVERRAMIIFNLPPQPDPQPAPEMSPKRGRLLNDLAHIEKMLRALDLHELQDSIDEMVAQFPAWSKTADPYRIKGVVYAITGQQITLLAACELLSARKELPFRQGQT